MEYIRESFLNKKSALTAANSLLLFEGTHNFKILKREKRTHLKSLVKSINLSLNEREKRCETLTLLLLILPQCDNSILNEDGEKWFKLCSQVLKIDMRAKEKVAILKIMTFILRKCAELKELHNKIAKANLNFLSFFYSSYVQGAIIEPAFECLYEYLLQFPGEALKHRTAIEKFVCSFLNFPVKANPVEVEKAARVYASLPIPRVGATGENLERGKQISQIIILCHHAMDILFKGVQENEVYSESKEPYFIPLETLESAKILKDPVRLRLTASLILTNSFIFIAEFLTWTNAQFISISPKNILRVIFRVLQVEVKMLNRIAGQEMLLLSFLLPSLHIRALTLLQKLIQSGCCKNFYGAIGEQLVITLRAAVQVMRNRSQNDSAEGGESSENITQGEMVKVMAYSTFSTLIQVSQGRHSVPVELTSILKKDIEISKDSVTLKALKGSELSLNLKKKKTKGYSISPEELAKDSIVTDAALSLQVPSAIASLQLINNLFLYAHHSMPRIMVKELRETLLTLMQTSRAGVYIFPEVRTAFYKAILSYALYPHPLFPLPYNVVHHSLLVGSRDSDPRVRQVCTEGLATVSFIMANPQVSSLSDFVKLQNQLGFNKEVDELCNGVGEDLIIDSKNELEVNESESSESDVEIEDDDVGTEPEMLEGDDEMPDYDSEESELENEVISKFKTATVVPVTSVKESSIEIEDDISGSANGNEINSENNSEEADDAKDESQEADRKPHSKEDDEFAESESNGVYESEAKSYSENDLEESSVEVNKLHENGSGIIPEHTSIQEDKSEAKHSKNNMKRKKNEEMNAEVIKKKKTEEDDVTLEEMLASFVNADPDSDY